MDLKSHVGEDLGPYQEQVSTERLQTFASAVLARASVGAGALPPTWLTICRKGLFDWLTRLGFELKEVLHGEQEYEYLDGYQSLGGGPFDVIYKTVFKNVTEKHGASGSMHILVFETEIAVGRPVAIARSTVIIKRRAEGAGS